MAEVLNTTSYQWPKWPGKKTDAVDDKATTDEDSPVTINVLENDTNAKGVYKIFPVKETTTDLSLTDDVLTDSVAAAEDSATSFYSKPYTITLESGATVKLENGTITYDPNDKFEHLNDGDIASDSFGYAAYGSYNTDRARVDVTIKGVTDDDEPPTGNQAPVANNDKAYLPSYYPYPYPLPSEETADSTTATTTDASLDDDLIYTTLAIGEEGDPYPYPNDVYIDVLANDSDPDGDDITVGRINGQPVEPGTQVKLDSGAKVTLDKDGTLFYDGVDYYSLDPLATEGDATVTASGDADALVLWEGYPIDTFTYQAKDVHGAESKVATVSIYQSPIYYYDTATDPVLDTSTDVGDPSLAVV